VTRGGGEGERDGVQGRARDRSVLLVLSLLRFLFTIQGVIWWLAVGRAGPADGSRALGAPIPGALIQRDDVSRIRRAAGVSAKPAARRRASS